MIPSLEPLRRDGFAVIDNVSVAAFERLVAELGEVRVRSSVELRARATSYLASPARVPLHTDHPDIDLVAWRCEVQDVADGASLLVDLRAAVAELEPTTRAALRGVKLPCPSLFELTRAPLHGTRPVLMNDDDVYFAEWLTPQAEGPCQAWPRLLATVARVAPTEIRLARGQVLLVDNHRMAHGRRRVSANSARRLQRAWVVTRDRERSSIALQTTDRDKP